jgi:cytochrome c oxidase subunit II
MNKKYIGLIFGAIMGVVVAVCLVNYGKDPGTNTFTAFDPTVEYTMTELFKSPPPITEHGKNVDRVLVFVHVLMGVLFVGWSLYFLYCIFKFRESNHPKADYHGARSKFWTTLAEYGVIAAEVVLIVCFAIPLWAEVMNDTRLKEIKEQAIAKDDKNGTGLEIHILAKQFDWSARYAGNDKIFAQQDIRFADKSNNPFGLDPNDTSIDDVLVLAAKDRKGAIVVPKDTAVALKITSMDVIHSFKVLPLRVCKDAIPGLQLPIHFEVKTKYLEPKEENKDGEHVFLITCAQLCGDGHGSMNGYLKVISKEKFKQWLEAKSNAAQQARRENLAAAK